MTFQTTIGLVPGEMRVADIPDDVATHWLQTYGKRCCYQLNDGAHHHAALLPRGTGGWYIIVNKQARAAAGASVGNKVKVTLLPDTSEFQSEMPDELAEVLATDPEADALFRTLTAGRQRSLIYLVTAVKSTDKRIERALKIAKALQTGQTDPRKILTHNPR